GAQAGEHGADRVAVADHDPVDAADLARLGVDLQPAGRAHQRERRLRAGAGHLKGHGATGLGQRTVREEGPPPRRLGVAGGAGDHLTGQAAHRPTVVVDQSGLPGERLAVTVDAYDVPRALAQPRRGEDENLGLVPEHLADVLDQPAGGGVGVQLRLDHDTPADQVEPAREAQQGGYLGLAAAGLENREPAQLVLNHTRHRHVRQSPNHDLYGPGS